MLADSPIFAILGRRLISSYPPCMEDDWGLAIG
jgi:hypothetical protein